MYYIYSKSIVMKKLFTFLSCLFLLQAYAQIEGTWKLSPTAGALAVGPNQGDGSWWSNSAADVTARPCLFDDSLTFLADGTLNHYMDGSTWVEAWQGAAADGCAAPVAPHDGVTNAPYSYVYNSATGELTVNGIGAHIGLPKVINGSEINNPANAASSITYLISMSPDNNTMTADISVGFGWWRFVYERIIHVSSAPFVGTWQLKADAGSLGVGPNQGDMSWWANSLADVSTRACLFDDSLKFDADGTLSHFMDGNTWVEAWQGAAADGCAVPVAPHDGVTNAPYSYVYNSATGELTVNGIGAHIGLPKVINGSEINNPANAASSITYLITMSPDNNTMTADISVGFGWWRFVYGRIIPAATSPIVGTWQLKPDAGSLAVGPGQGDGSWWSSSSADANIRSCLFDDSLKFDADGTLTHFMDGSTWVEGWQGAAADGCAAPVAPHDGVTNAPFSYVYDPATSELTVNGIGAHLGLAKVINGSEISDPANAAASITYLVSFSPDNNTMYADVNVGAGWWRFVYQRSNAVTIPDPNVTFRVNMSNYTGTIATGVFVNGSFNGWCGTCNPLTDMGNGVWQATLPIPAGPIEYLFTVDGFTDAEVFSGTETCLDPVADAFNNRYLDVTGDVTLPAVCFESCDACPSNVTQLLGTWKLKADAGSLAVGPALGDGSWWSNSVADVTTRACLFDDSIRFEADGTMLHYMDGSTWLEAWQGANPDGCGTPVAPHDGTGPFTYTYSGGELTVNGLGGHIGLAKVYNGGELTSPSGAPASVTYQLTFANSDNTMIADINFGVGWWRFVYERVQQIIVPDPNVTFTVDMSSYTGTIADAVYVNGTFNNWCGTCNPMTDMGAGIWSVTLPIPAGYIEYLYTVDGWTDLEVFTGSEPCMDTVQDGFFNRYLDVTADTQLPVVCFESCEACISGINEQSVNAVSITPNPAVSELLITSGSIITEIAVYDPQGRLVKKISGTSNKVDLNVTHLKSGTYVLRIQDQNGVSIQKFLKL
jgi:hypothetical protein